MDTVVYLKNRSPSRSLTRCTPFESLTGERPNLSHLRVVGCAAWSLILKGKRDSKLAPRARLCCFLGYSSTQKGYKLWDLIERAVIISRDVTLDETMSASQRNRPKVSLNELKHNLDLSHQVPLPSSTSNSSTTTDVFEVVGDGPRAVEAVGAEDPVGAEEGKEEEQEENVVERHHEQPQYRGWDYEVDPRYARSPTPTPELEAEPGPAPQGRNQFVTRSGRHGV